MANYIEKADQQIANLFADWSILTTLIAVALVALVAYPIFYPDEPDTHPLLLARQSTAAPIRNKNESAVYRSPEVPYGYPLRSGLNVKAAGAPRWANGKDGDLRDVWREVMRGGTIGEDGKEIAKGGILTVYGKEEVVEHKLEELTKQIVFVGQHLQGAGVTKVGIYLPNGVEYLSTVFACAFYGITPVLLPYNLPHPKAYELINSTGADGLICAAGNLPLEDLATECQNLKLVNWVVEKTSRHMDWNGVPGAAAGRLAVSVWHDIISDNETSATVSLPDSDPNDKPPATALVSIWQPADLTVKPIITNFSSGNLVSAISALMTALPLRQRFSPADLVLPADSFTHLYVLCQTFAALYTHVSVALTSVAGPGVDLALATRAVNPTVIIASAESMLGLHKTYSETVASLPVKFSRWMGNRALTAGRMPAATDSLLMPSASSSTHTPGRLRLIMTSERTSTPQLSSSLLSDLRLYTRARVCYALTAAAVAGAVAQTSVFDYRRGASHFGIPLSSVEVKFLGPEEEVGATRPIGELWVTGSAVAGGEGSVGLGARGTVRADGTVALA